MCERWGAHTVLPAAGGVMGAMRGVRGVPLGIGVTGAVRGVAGPVLGVLGSSSCATSCRQVWDARAQQLARHRRASWAAQCVCVPQQPSSPDSQWGC